jgi:hypothetical protein
MIAGKTHRLPRKLEDQLNKMEKRKEINHDCVEVPYPVSIALNSHYYYAHCRLHTDRLIVKNIFCNEKLKLGEE